MEVNTSSVRALTLAAAASGGLALGASAEGALASQVDSPNAASVNYVSTPEGLATERLDETRSNNVLDKYDLINPSALKDVDSYNNPNTAIECMRLFKEGMTKYNKQPGFMTFNRQRAKLGGTAVRVSFGMIDFQFIPQAEGFNTSCSWYMKTQEIRTQLYKLSQSGSKKVVRQQISSPNPSPITTGTTLTARLQHPGYSGSLFEMQKPEQVEEVLHASKPIKKNDKYFIKYTYSGQASDEIRSHGHLSKGQQRALKPVKFSILNHVQLHH